MGVTLSGAAATFMVWAPNASRVAVTGSFNAWREDEHLLARGDDDCWSITVEGVRAGDEYLYVIDNRGGDEFNPGQRGLRRSDPWARATRHSSGNAVIVDVASELVESGLADDGFETPARPDWLIYQAHIGSFTGLGDGVDTGPTATGTFEQFASKLDYIRALGFNAVALLPIHENPGDGQEGYAPSHLFAPESSYGSPLQLRQLIRAAHDRGLAVIFDVVWNHFSDVDNRLWEFDGMTRDGGIFFEGGERSPWGPRPAFWKAEVRDFIVNHARHCFEEYRVDGLRIDAADEIAREVLLEVVTAVRANPLWQDKLLIVEWTGHDAGIWPQLTEHLRFDRVWALGDPPIFVNAVGATSVESRVEFLLQLVHLPDAALRIRYLLGSHDTAHDNEAGARVGYRHFVELVGGRDDWLARAKARIGWVLCVALPGTPMCFMGAECHLPGYWNPRPDANGHHSDHRFDWSVAGDPIGLQMRALVTDANRLWWNTPVLRQPGFEIVQVDGAAGVLAFLRPDEAGRPLLIVVNLSENSWPDQGYQLPSPGGIGAWQVVLDSQAPNYGGDPLTNPERLEVEAGQLRLSLPQWSALILTPT
ncbi:MAG: alpha-amylase family glycosyl hydrolase [Gemmatimonadota bacterium]